MLDKVQVGVRLKELRKKNRLTQDQVATYLGIDQSLVSKIEDGERAVSSVVLSKMAVLFCCPVSELLSETAFKPVVQVAFRADGLTDADLQDMGFINKIFMNQVQMSKVLERANHD